MRPLDWKELRDICIEEGCALDREKGDHYIMVKPGLKRPLVIPRKRALREDIVLNIARELGLTGHDIRARIGNAGKGKKGKPKKR